MGQLWAKNFPHINLSWSSQVSTISGQAPELSRSRYREGVRNTKGLLGVTTMKSKVEGSRRGWGSCRDNAEPSESPPAQWGVPEHRWPEESLMGWKWSGLSPTASLNHWPTDNLRRMGPLPPKLRWTPKVHINN